MMTQQQIDEAYDLALSLCGDLCRDYHATRPYLIASGMRGGAARDQSTFEPLLQRHVSHGSRILIAGAADTGLLNFVLDAVGKRSVEITIVDACPTPLELCRRYAASTNIAITTIESDIEDVTSAEGFDVVIGHAILAFVPAERRVGFLRHLATLLRPEGVLILAYPVDPPKPGGRKNFTERVLGGLAANGFALPADKSFLLEALDSFEREKEWAPPSTEERNYHALLAPAGLSIIEMVDTNASSPTGESETPVRPRPRRYVVAR